MASFQNDALRAAADWLIIEDRQFYKLRASTLKIILSDEITNFSIRRQCGELFEVKWLMIEDQ